VAEAAERSGILHLIIKLSEINSGHYWWCVKSENYVRWCGEEGLTAMEN